MSEWNFDISQAPRGRFSKQTMTNKSGVVRRVEVFEPDRVMLASKCGKVTPSYWLPKENRWLMFGKDEQPVAWMPYPTHPWEAMK